MTRTRLLLALVFLGISIPSLALAGTLVDPATNPGGFLDQLFGFAHTAWPVAIALGVYGLLELLAKLGKEGGKLAWLGTGRVSLVIAGAIGVLGAALNAYLGAGSVQAALVAAVVALAAYWHPKAPAAVGITPAELPRARALLRQSGRASLTLLAVLALVAVSVVGCLSSAQKQDAATVGKAAGSAAEACAVSDVQAYATDVGKDLSGASYEQDLATFQQQHHFTQDFMNCLVTGVLAGVAALVGEIHGEPNPAVLHAKAYLAAHGKTAALDAYSNRVTAAWMRPWNPRCEPSTVTPAVDCRPYESQHYDGCHWTCEAR